MGNSFGCSASGERLVSAARDGDLVEAKMLLDCNPYFAKYSTFGGLNSPLHFAAAKGHNEIVALLLENGADVNSRNYCGQTALMQACIYGHWEVVQTLLLFKCNVTRPDYLSGRTALHFAAVNGHVRCMRLVLADFTPSTPFVSINSNYESRDDTIVMGNHSALSKFVNRSADGGITALHMAALNGYFDCVQLLLDLHANVLAATFPYGSSVDLIGSGSTPLHYAARGGNLKCCQILLAKGASRSTVNSSGSLPVDVAKMWGRHWLEPLLDPNTIPAVPVFPPSNYLALPLMSVLNIARDYGLNCSTNCSDEADICSVCLERICTVAAEGCGHKLCVRCALYLCSTSSIVPSESRGPPGSIPCPLCRRGIVSFKKLPGSPAKEVPMSLSLCNPCMVNNNNNISEANASTNRFRKQRVASVSPDIFCPVTCSPFPSVSVPMCTCSDAPFLSCERHEVEMSDESSQRSEPARMNDEVHQGGMRLDKVSCTNMFWGRRSCSREHQCNAEISA
ncbi:E3 ubiquitin-protein ligase XBAT33-like [Impatiens glandulifera]|uniref:E3 ubiquitin-protein ligase XBAT33-like n=1 Tax=Impatiens glandulifera TaxID=253017 RepID=UPI001FB127A1|nr:E3 ubiquitin-protein ligase XBAT33-like [Impatiens glandulifera]